MSYNRKSFMTKKKAFTLIELLIVIAIIGILFIVLVSKVDFATDKAKATGVQTDFRSFQMALDTVSKEKAGFNSFGWNTGDANANGVRDSVDEGDANEDGIYQDGETWTGHKKYLETWTDKYSLIKPGTTFEADGYDKDAIFALETAINKNLDPKLHITIDAKTGLITMANGAQDPWNTQYHGAYISAEDGMDRGAIVMYSNGANQKFGSEHDIANGVPTVIVPGNNKDGADDYSLVVCYTYTNGYGEVGALTTGFSNNQTFLTGNGNGFNDSMNDDDIINVPNYEEDIPVVEKPSNPYNNVEPGLYENGSNFTKLKFTWQELVDMKLVATSGVTAYGTSSSGPSQAVIDGLKGELALPSTTTIPTNAFYKCSNITKVIIPESVTSIGSDSFSRTSLTELFIPESVTTINAYAFRGTKIKSLYIPNTVKSIGSYAFDMNYELIDVYFESGSTLTSLTATFSDCKKLESIVLPDSVTKLKDTLKSTAISTITLPANLETLSGAFYRCENLQKIIIPKTLQKIELNYTFTAVNSDVYYKGELEDWLNIDFVAGGSSTMPIGNYYMNGKLLSNIVIPNNITHIDAGVFSGWQNLNSITFHSGITNIDDVAFYSSTLATINNMQDMFSLSNIGNYAFSNCLISEIIIPSNVYTIGKYAFDNCDNVQNVTIFSNNLTINSSAFQLSDNLENVYFNGTLENWMNCTFANNANPCWSGANLYIGGALLENVIVPETINEIKNNVFAGAKSIKTVQLHDNVTSIGNNAFYRTKISEIVIPNSVTNIGNGAFYWIPSGMNLYIANQTPPAFGQNMFDGVNFKIYVPSELLEIYQTASGWKSYKAYIVAQP